MIIPVGPWGDQELVLLRKRGEQLEQRAVLSVRFVPMTGGRNADSGVAASRQSAADRLMSLRRSAETPLRAAFSFHFTPRACFIRGSLNYA